MAQIEHAPDMSRVTIREQRRTDGQNDRFHAICTDIAKSNFYWDHKPRSKEQWKTLLISGHSIATQGKSEICEGLERELINLRESSALMSVKRASSLIEYAEAFCAMNGIKLRARDD
jgi:hypothetical protein